jgi:hypothetical protein
VGALASFLAATPDDIRARCAPPRLADIAAQIGKQNAEL